MNGANVAGLLLWGGEFGAELGLSLGMVTSFSVLPGYSLEGGCSSRNLDRIPL